MSEFKVFFAILHTMSLTAEKNKELFPEISDEEAQNYGKVFALLDGQKAIMCSSLGGDDNFGFCGIADQSVDREVSYLLEQDPWMGCYIDQREAFDKDYDSGEYSRDALFCIGKEYVEVLPKETLEALVEADTIKSRDTPNE